MNRSLYIQFISALLFLIATIAAYGIWYSIITAKSAQVATLAQQADSITAAATNVAEEKAQLVQLATQQVALNQYFISTADVVPFLEQLAKTGKYFGAKVSVVSVAATTQPPFGKLQVSLSITGTFDSVLRTIGDIEYGPYDTNITNLSFEKSADQSSASTTNGLPQWIANATFAIGAQTQAASQATTTP